ncbi:MAG: hypothetical protein ACTS3F_11915 [Phycisphaerales bacterium]
MLASTHTRPLFTGVTFEGIRGVVLGLVLALAGALACPAPAYAGGDCQESINSDLTGFENEVAADLASQLAVLARAIFYADAIGCIPPKEHERLKRILVNTDPLLMTLELIDVSVAIDECLLEGGMTPEEAAEAHQRIENLNALAEVLWDQMFGFCEFVDGIPLCE